MAPAIELSLQLYPIQSVLGAFAGVVFLKFHLWL